jgi:hypothetical protein
MTCIFISQMFLAVYKNNHSDIGEQRRYVYHPSEVKERIALENICLDFIPENLVKYLVKDANDNEFLEACALDVMDALIDHNTLCIDQLRAAKLRTDIGK